MSEQRPGDSGRITREYFDALLVEMRLIDSDTPSTEMRLYGHTFSTPVMTAALSHLNGVHPTGMVGLAEGAAKANAVMWAGMGDEDELEAIVATGAKTIKIIKPYYDNADIHKKIRHAEKNGALAVGIDIDHAFNGRGAYDSVRGLPMKPKSFDEIKAFVDSTKLPFVIKGVLSVRDAEKCLKAGVRGIVVSHHHGIMPYAVPPLRLLPDIMAVVGGSMPVFIDCNVESGMDVFKALALGATAASVGRALMGPLGEGGADAVWRAIDDITYGLAHAMAMTGAGDLKGIDPSVVWKPER